VLEVAVREINEVTDISISYIPVKTGRRISGIQFIYQHKQGLERMTAHQKAEKRLKKGER
jgi:plasmid replication initiation protein